MSKQSPADRLIKAFSHPLRMRALAILSERVASPSGLAKELGESIGVVSYHVRQLEELGCVELVKTEPRRGAVEHYYRATARPFFSDDDWKRLPKRARTSLSTGTLADIWRDIGRALASGSIDDRADRHLSWTNLVLDDAGWEAVNGRLKEVLEWAAELQSQRPGGGDEDDANVSSRLVLMHYPAPAGGGTAKASGAKRSAQKSKPRAHLVRPS